MSIQEVAWVLEHEEVTSGRERLVLLSIANHEGDGGSWPAVATIAKEARCSERNVQYALKELERMGVIRVIRRGGGTQFTRGDRRPNRYVIVHPQRGAAEFTPSDSRGAETCPTGCKNGAHGVKPVAPEPSLEPSLEPRVEIEQPVDNPTELIEAARAALGSVRKAS